MKYVVIMCVPIEAMEKWRTGTPPEEMKAQSEELGAEMGAWMRKYEAAFIEKGWPLGKNTRLTAAGATPATNPLNYLCIIERDSLDDALAMLKECPHLLRIPDGYFEIMEVTHPGL